tara:strand:+ start:9561 stop:10409 length:849 start_codon:yes stop_codon:yes gene_type:complete
MAPRQPKTKEEALRSLLNDLIEEYLLNQKGIVTVNDFALQGALKKAEKNKEGGLDSYYLVKALVNVIQGRLNTAEGEFKKALRISPNDPVILTNYSVALRLLNKNNESNEILIKVIKEFKFFEDSMLNNILFNSIPELEIKYLQEVTQYLETDRMNGIIDGLISLKEDLQEIDISFSEFQEVVELLRSMVNKRTRQQFIPRFSIDNGLDRHLKIEVFLNINTQEAAELNSEFTTYFVDYIFDKERHDLSGKFLVFFKQQKSRYDGTESPDALYLGINEELVA